MTTCCNTTDHHEGFVHQITRKRQDEDEDFYDEEVSSPYCSSPVVVLGSSPGGSSGGGRSTSQHATATTGGVERANCDLLSTQHQFANKMANNGKRDSSKFSCDGDDCHSSTLSPFTPRIQHDQNSSPSTPNMHEEEKKERRKSALVNVRGKHPANRTDERKSMGTTGMTQEAAKKKKGFFANRRERKIKEIEKKPVYRWNYKLLAKYLKYKGFDKKSIKILKTERFNGYIIISAQVNDLTILGLSQEVATKIIRVIGELSDRQDVFIETNFDCEIELPTNPIRSNSALVN